MVFQGRPCVQQAEDGRWVLLRPLRYQGSRESWTIPAGFVTDFASVPAAARWLIPADGPWTAAAIAHDWFCDVGIRRDLITSRDADGLFRRMMRELGVPLPRRWAMWAGVRWGAVANPLRRPGVLADLPLVLAISVLVAPLVLPVSLVVALGLALDHLIDRCVRLLTREAC
ncbi:DUF1353 domain-containing protein [Klenkia sp. LSe6-5]|uniref:DUF1353 domain-containing protein n=1 Tax=Klenkia sesuvii TaxID=3103137 RepID=A0ABU8DYM7_9ACTN